MNTLALGRMSASLMERLENKTEEAGHEPDGLVIHECAIVVRWSPTDDPEADAPETITYRSDTHSDADTAELFVEAAGMAIRQVTRR